MSIDGFAMSNLGLNKDLSSAAQLMTQTEFSIAKEAEVKVKDVTKAAEKQGIKSKKDDGSNGGSLAFSKDEAEEEEEQEGEFRSKFNEKEFETRDPKEFSVRINSNNDMIELYNNTSKNIVETISANDLMKLISKLNSASGILVNKKI